MSRHPVGSAPARRQLFVAVALAFLLASLLVTGTVPSAQNAEAAKDPSISITADHQTVKSGDQVTLKIKLQNVKSATLNGEALKDGKDKVEKKVTVCATTTYTVAAMPKDGGPKISQSLTIYATGASTKTECLPDLVVVSLTPSQQSAGKNVVVRVDYVIKNVGKQATGPFVARAYFSDIIMEDVLQRASLAPGETASQVSHWSVRKDVNLTLPVKVVVDDDRQVAEADETNNTQTDSVTIGTPKVSPNVFQKLDKVDHLSDLFKIKP